MKNSLIAIFLLAATLTMAPLAVSQIQMAKATGGEVQGVVADGIAMFKGIPFAAPPVDEVRWKAPQQLRAWTGIKNPILSRAAAFRRPAWLK